MQKVSVFWATLFKSFGFETELFSTKKQELSDNYGII